MQVCQSLGATHDPQQHPLLAQCCCLSLQVMLWLTHEGSQPSFAHGHLVGTTLQLFRRGHSRLEEHSAYAECMPEPLGSFRHTPSR